MVLTPNKEERDISAFKCQGVENKQLVLYDVHSEGTLKSTNDSIRFSLCQQMGLSGCSDQGNCGVGTLTIIIFLRSFYRQPKILQ